MSWNRILAEAAQLDRRNEVDYFDVGCKKVLNEVRVPNLPFELSANPYLNCELGCAYCYAREYTGLRERSEASDFDRRVYLKTGAPEALTQELRRMARAHRLGRPITIGTATDPYQPVERRRRLTRALLQRLVDAAEHYDGGGALRLSITTKSDAILGDLDLLRRLNEAAQVRVNVSMISLETKLLRSLEPRAPTPSRRLKAIEGLTAAGIPVGVFCMPVLPELTDDPATLRRLICASQEAGARYLAARVLFLRGATRDSFFAWLARERPSLLGLYRRHYRSSTPPARVQERIRGLVETLRRQYALPAELPFEAKAAEVTRQLDLFESPPAPPQGPAVRRLPLASGWAAGSEPRAAGAA